MEVTPTASTNIHRVEAEFLRDEDDRARKKPIDKTSIVVVEPHVSSTVELGLEEGITSPSPSLHSSFALIPTSET